jgi:hypothetical protein
MLFATFRYDGTTVRCLSGKLLHGTSQLADRLRLCISLVRIALIGVLSLAAPSGWAGGLYSNGFSTDPSFFPIGVWLQSPTRASSYKAIGINTFVGLYHGPTEEQLAQLAKHDMFAAAEQNDVGLNSVNRHVIKGWLHGDEPDNAQPIGFGRYGPCIPASEVVRRTREMKSRDTTRPVMINFGQGVVNEYWRGRGSCNGNQKYYDDAIQGADILSALVLLKSKVSSSMWLVASPIS